MATTISFLFRAACAAVLGIACSLARATPPNNVVAYSPVSESIYGTLPVSQTYTLAVTSPAALATFPTTVTLRAAASSSPIGDLVTAATYVSFSVPSLTFTAAGQTQSVDVTITMPASALTSSVPAGAYTYGIYTDGWPSNINPSNATINASVTMPTSSGGNPPTIAITGPANYASYSYQAGTFPQTVGFTFAASTDASSPVITSVAASFGTPTNMAPVSVTPTGLGTASVTGAGNITFPAPGTYELSATATNSINTASDQHSITVNVTAPPPTVQITSPTQTPPASYTYRVGDAPLDIPFTFVGSTTYGGIADLTAKVDGVAQSFTISGLNTLTATATVHLIYDNSSAQGTHTLSVTATDESGQTATTTGSFSINYLAPLPQVVIQTPSPAETFYVPVGASTTSVPYQFTTTVSNGFVVDAVAAALGTTAVTPNTTGMGSPAATSSGTFALPPGSYTLVASGGSKGVSATQSVSFTVVAGAQPPSVTIDSPADGTQALLAPGGNVTIPFQFTGTSHNPGSVITAMTATLDGTPISFNATYGNPTAVGTATLTLNTAQTYTLAVTATDDVGTTPEATSTFTVAPMPPHAVSGLVYFDIDANGTYDAYDYGLAGITVALQDASGATLGTAVTDDTGHYSFPGLYPATYTVVATPFAGLTATTPLRETAAMSTPADVTAEPIGFALNPCALNGMTANGLSMGFWSNNVGKALAGTTQGVQVDASTIQHYTDTLSQFALNPFDGLTEQQAAAIWAKRSSLPADLLAKQLLAAEYNYEHGAYLNGNAALTYAFVYWGEWVLSNSSTLSSTYVLNAKNWFEAYDTTHGGALSGPTCSGSTSGGTTTVTSSTSGGGRRKHS